MDAIISRGDSLILRLTKESDLDFVLNAEGAPENGKYVYQWTRGQHLRAMEDKDIMHIIIEKKESKFSVGYLILSGLDSPNHNVELKRIVIDDKGKGFGRETLRMVKRLAFEKLNVHRLWLDVKDHNHKAIDLYKSEGFIQEGIMRECVYYEGKYESMIVMSILENEYRSQEKQEEKI